MQMLRGRDVDWRAGRASVYVFHSGDDALQVAHDAYGAFISENGLGPGAFPSLKRMESDVVDMGLALQHAPDGAAGSMTSGGTESILLAMKTCRDWSRRNRPVRGIPRVVVPRTAHPAFDKAAHYLGMQIVRVPVTSTGFVADPDAMAAALDEDTVMLVGSAPCFPFGVTDPIEDQIERFAPGFRDCILARHIMNCADLERHNANLVGGAVNGGSLDVWHLLARPVLSPNPYRTPLPGVDIFELLSGERYPEMISKRGSQCAARDSAYSWS
jgi:phytoene dehydrogenase-like protein